MELVYLLIGGDRELMKLVSYGKLISSSSLLNPIKGHTSICMSGILIHSCNEYGSQNRQILCFWECSVLCCNRLINTTFI